MSLYYITGVPGSGKTTVLAELTRRGYEAYDTDYFADFYDIFTGEKALNGRTAQKRTKEWRQHHEWKLPVETVAALRAKAGSAVIFLCGVTANDDDFWKEFANVFCLHVPPDEIERRLLGRPDQDDYGKNPHELAIAIEWAAYSKQQYEDLGAVIIDAAQAVEHIAQAIIDQIHDR